MVIRIGFFDLDESFSVSVKLGDNSKIMVKGKGSIKLQIEGVDYFETSALLLNSQQLGSFLQLALLRIGSLNNSMSVMHFYRGTYVRKST